MTDIDLVSYEQTGPNIWGALVTS